MDIGAGIIKLQQMKRCDVFETPCILVSRLRIRGYFYNEMRCIYLRFTYLLTYLLNNNNNNNNHSNKNNYTTTISVRARGWGAAASKSGKTIIFSGRR